jgi:hypothetical protein
MFNDGRSNKKKEERLPKRKSDLFMQRKRCFADPFTRAELLRTISLKA